MSEYPIAPRRTRKAARPGPVNVIGRRRAAIPTEFWTAIAAFVLGLAFYVLPFLNEAGSQIWGVGLLVAASLVALLGGISTRFGPTPFEVLLLGAILLSGVIAAFKSNMYIVNYSVFMVAVLFSVAIIVRHFTLQEIFVTAARAHVANCATVLLVYWQQLPVILNATSPDRWALRFMPFDMTPNLVGWVYGLGGIIAVYAAVKARGTARVIYALGALLSFVYIFGASARGALLATTVSSALIVLANYRRLPSLGRRTVVYLAVAAAIILALLWQSIFNYLSVMLELDSPVRGLGSGATGRTDLWQRGLQYMANSPLQIFFGSGLRSSNEEFTGFQSESSYITILIDSGLLLGPCLIATILFAPLALLMSGRKTGAGRTEVIFLAWLIIFAASQSFFNRYLLAIGNSGSLLLLLCYAFAWLGFFSGNMRQPRRPLPQDAKLR